MYELHFAVPMCGAILNTLNTRLDAHTISVLLSHCKSKLLFVDHLFRSLVLQAISVFPPQTQVPMLVFLNSDDHMEVIESPAVDLDLNDVRTYESMIEKGDAGYKWVQPKSEWDPMVLNYTSGTTSSPKGVAHSHRGLYIVTVDSLIEWSVPKQPVYLWTLPMFHANGWCFPWAMAAVGGTNVCLRKLDGPMLYQEMHTHGVTHMCGASIVLKMLADVPSPLLLTHPVHILTSGAPPPANVLASVAALGFIVTHGYGLTETGGVVVSCAWKSDVGVIHSDGYMEIKDRSKDIIISGGENISSIEIESILYSHPAINEAAAVACPDKYWGETPCAFVSLKLDAIKPTSKDIIEFCRARMPHYMVPKIVVFVAELPKTSTGKIQKSDLRMRAKALKHSLV
ncbi:2-succinylbenzoate--CoA ligase [Thalictrum thalictroides]|uniref:2-succinylbenzoate--CoA ligase n=1 Tax=Thalictrum thalictroides TaxID=46969 RepID=A0A7J6WES6_THATH|nr:2-succinylbenzoate--CoA ligase [Thalictrum thalictroides]